MQYVRKDAMICCMLSMKCMLKLNMQHVMYKMHVQVNHAMSYVMCIIMKYAMFSRKTCKGRLGDIMMHAH